MNAKVVTHTQSLHSHGGLTRCVKQNQTGSSIYFVVWFTTCDVKSYRVIILHSATAVRMFKMTSLLAPTPSPCSCHPRKWKRSVPTVPARQLHEAETTYLCISRIQNSAMSSVDLLANISPDMHYNLPTIHKHTL